MSVELYLSLLSTCGGRPAGLAQQAQVLVGTQPIHLQFLAGDQAGDAGCLLARTDVLHLRAAPGVALCRLLLQANAFWAGIRDGALGLRGSQVVMLSVSQRIAVLDADRLARLLEEMADDARRWAAVLHAAASAQTLAPSTPGMQL